MLPQVYQWVPIHKFSPFRPANTYIYIYEQRALLYRYMYAGILYIMYVLCVCLWLNTTQRVETTTEREVGNSER